MVLVFCYISLILNMLLVILYISLILNMLLVILYISIILNILLVFLFISIILKIFLVFLYLSIILNILPLFLYIFFLILVLHSLCNVRFCCPLFYSPFRFQLFTYSWSRNVLDLSFALILLKSFQKIYYTESCSRSITIEYRHINKNY